jgi:hypothetical protein
MLSLTTNQFVPPFQHLLPFTTMKEGPEGALTQRSLQAKDHRELLDVADSLRSYIGHHIDLPAAHSLR